MKFKILTMLSLATFCFTGCNVLDLAIRHDSQGGGTPLVSNSIINGWEIIGDHATRGMSENQLKAKRIFQKDTKMIRMEISGNTLVVMDVVEKDLLAVYTEKEFEESIKERNRNLPSKESTADKSHDNKKPSKKEKYELQCEVSICPYDDPTKVTSKGITVTTSPYTAGSIITEFKEGSWWGCTVKAKCINDGGYSGQIDMQLRETGFRWLWSPWVWHTLKSKYNYTGTSYYTMSNTHGPWLNNYILRINIDKPCSVGYYMSW